MESLRADYTEVWVASQNVPLIRIADCVRSIASTGLDWLGIPDREPPAHTLDLLRGFDSIVSWYGTKREEFRAAVSRFPFAFLQALPEDGTGLHATDYYLRQIEELRCESGTRRPACPSPVPPVSGHLLPGIPCERRDGGFVAIHPFSGGPKKNWPLQRFHEVACNLPGPVKWCTGPEEKLDGAVRIDNLYELAQWLASARLYIGNDSGITHLAAAVGTPVIAIFGPTDPAVWGPSGELVHILRANPIENIQPGAVLGAAEGIEAAARSLRYNEPRHG